ncbi:MAG: D-glycero-alpha-D-manno-heptose-1,7-bisphosphate 7-phosphatase [Candidatus Thorarchaeota archaeon]
MNKKKAILLDRDGVLIEDKNYAYKIEDFKLLDGVIEGLKLLQNDFLFFIITNQSGIGRGYYTVQDFQNFNNHLINVLKENQIEILNSYFCPHLKEENCECRKPNTKFIDDIIEEFNVDIKNSWMIGDHPSDIQFGINAGCRTIFLTTGHGDKHLDELKALEIKSTHICDNFLKAAREILRLIQLKNQTNY